MTILDEFLAEILGFIKTRNASNLQLWLRVEPPLPNHYYRLKREVKAKFNDNEALEKHVIQHLPETDTTNPAEGDVWPGFHALILEFLIFWRDVDFQDLLETHGQLSSLVK